MRGAGEPSVVSERNSFRIVYYRISRALNTQIHEKILSMFKSLS